MESRGAKIKEPLGVPLGASGWYYNLAGAIKDSNPDNSGSSSSSDNDDDDDDTSDRQLVIAWDKPPKDLSKAAASKKMYAVFKNHSVFWENLNNLPLDGRYAYEVLPARKPCRGYWDIEFCLSIPSSLHNMDEAKNDTTRLMQAWIAKLKHIIDVQLKIQAIVSVLDGTRVIKVDESLSLSTKVKFSYHVILVNVAFVHNQSATFQAIKTALPTLYDLALELSGPKLTWLPPKETKGAPDMCVYGQNQLFRCLACAKRGNSTPLVFSSLTDTYNPQDTFVSIINREANPNIIVVSEPKKTRKRAAAPKNDRQKRAKLSSGSAHQIGGVCEVEAMLNKYPQEMETIHRELQKLLIACGDSNTRVEKLVRVTSNLRYQCRNVNSRSCILSSEAHQSNNPILWLDSSTQTNNGELSNHYCVIYNCKSSECQGQGIIGEIFLDSESKVYIHSATVPPIINQNNPRGIALKATVETTRALQEQQPAMQAFINMLNDDNDTSASANDDTQQELIQTRDLVQEKLNGFGWAENELAIFGREKTYQAVKALQEKKICKITSPSVIFLRFKKDGVSYDHHSYESMQKLLKSTHYLKKLAVDVNPEPFHFFGSWTDDINARSYESVVCDPSKNSMYTGPHDINVWSGFYASSIPPISDLDLVRDLVEPITSHILNIVVNGVQDHADWFLDWLANIVQRPELKTQVPIVISGKQGVGKGIIIDFFRDHVLGPMVSTQIQNPGQDLFSRFANKHVNKVLIQIDEGDGLAKYADHLKNLTTASHINYEIKGLMSMTTRNFLNIIITTNHERPVLVETSDRRFVLFKASDVNLGNTSYYSDLGRHLILPQVARAFYQFLMARDLTKYVDHFQASRPMTEYYLQARKHSISVLHKFISALINSQKYTSAAASQQLAEVSTAAIFKDFIYFLEQGRFQNSMTSSVFSSKLKNMDGVLKKSNKKGTFWSLDYPKIRSTLVKNNEYDDDITFD